MKEKLIHYSPMIIISIREYYTDREDLTDSILHFLLYVAVFAILITVNDSRLSIKNYKNITLQNLIDEFNNNHYVLIYSIYFPILLLYILLS
jgi:hypothetical protein